MLLGSSPGPAAAEDPAAPEATGSVDADLELLLDAGILYARERLGQQDEMYPYAFVMRRDGKVQRIKAAKGEKPEAVDGLTVVRENLRSWAGEGRFRATAVFADVLVELRGYGQTDALQAYVDHREGVCWTLYFPYWRTPERQLVIQDPVSVARRTGTFEHCGAKAPTRAPSTSGTAR